MTHLAEQRSYVLLTFVIYSVVLTAIGFYSQRKLQQSDFDIDYSDEFYTGGRSMGPVTVAFMVAASIASAGTFIGGPGLAYDVGLTNAVAASAQCFMNFCVLGEIGKKIGIIARRTNAQSFFDILYDRYENSSIVGIAGAISIILFLGAHATSQFVGGARLFESMTSLPYWVGLVLFSIVVLIYTALGGIRGVSTAIIVQGVTMTIAVFCLVFATISKLSPIEISMRKIASMDPMLISPWRWSPVFNFSLWCIFGLANISQPHGVTATLTYKDTKTMHRAMILGAIITIIWTFPLQLMGNLARVIYPNLEVADYAVPMLSATVLPPYLSGIILAGVAGAIQSTVGSITLVISASIVRDFYLTFVNPKASSKQQKSVTQFVTAAICIIVFLIALRPPKALEWVIMFALGGLAAAYFFPLLLGLYWWRANEYGACVSMGGGLLTYILSKLGIIPSFFGMDPVVISMLVSGILLVAVSLATPKPSKRVVMTYFGKGLNR